MGKQRVRTLIATAVSAGALLLSGCESALNAVHEAAVGMRHDELMRTDPNYRARYLRAKEERRQEEARETAKWKNIRDQMITYCKDNNVSLKFRDNQAGGNVTKMRLTTRCDIPSGSYKEQVQQAKQIVTLELLNEDNWSNLGLQEIRVQFTAKRPTYSSSEKMILTINNPDTNNREKYKELRLAAIYNGAMNRFQVSNIISIGVEKCWNIDGYQGCNALTKY